MAQIDFYIYIDQKLMEPDPTTGLPQLGNLSLVRKVAGTANVVFQSKTTAYFSNKNQFSWEQKYQIGANLTPPQPSAFVSASTGPKNIAAGQMCDWSSVKPNGPPLQYMPDAKQADQGFLTKYPTSSGMFGTKNQPSMWYNSVWCSTGGSTYSCIYTDTVPPLPGMTYRAYLVENKYQVSWETSNFAPGVFSGSWSNPWEFSIPPGENIKFVSWVSKISFSGLIRGKAVTEARNLKGYATATPGPTDSPLWYDYGTNDPGQHDPSKSIGNSGTPLSMNLALSSFKPVFVSMRLGWNGNDYTTAKKQENASAMMAYLTKSTSGWLVIQNVYIGTWVSADVGLRPNTSFGDYVPGETEGDKLRFYLRSLVNNIAPRYGPTYLDWNYGAGITSDDDTPEPQAKDLAPNAFSNFFKLFWQHLPPGAALDAAQASAGFLSGIILAKIKGDIQPTANLEYSSVTQSGNDKASTVFKVSGLNTTQFSQALGVAQTLIAQEAARKSPVPGKPNVPTPDDVKLTPDTNATFEDMFPSGQKWEHSQEAPNGQGRGVDDYSKPRLIEGGQQHYPEANGHYQQGQGYKYSIAPAVASY
ncbi:hypothetical protein CGLO_11256 [Colletotrichum gloeosporioides Cg-14]|uniref:Uncharacterized protein n=1 Tax=Colletotrichum gloeosporioides (strain Cg-14) TaxID=1237896 RepID=T0LMD0_COLGC|nr:hypothetical protein CGLO_11256 [Colletotrichum gloeosporioides Cg-14]